MRPRDYVKGLVQHLISRCPLSIFILSLYLQRAPPSPQQQINPDCVQNHQRGGKVLKLRNLLLYVYLTINLIIAAYAK